MCGEADARAFVDLSFFGFENDRRSPGGRRFFFASFATGHHRRIVNPFLTQPVQAAGIASFGSTSRQGWCQLQRLGIKGIPVQHGVQIFSLRRSLGRMAAIAAVCATVSTPALAAMCPAPDEHDSLTVRALQSRLMVAALSCSARDDYNRFVNRYTPHLADHAASMRKWFRKLHGGGHRQEVNRFVTRLANDASMLSIRNRPQFCAQSRDALSALLAAPRHQSWPTLRAVALETRWVRALPAGCEALSQNRSDK